jgi:3'-phosphoadenosine 5'-phosphosulfate sulfotransferase (PAPS reductase)/FAD synthetase
VNVISSSYGNDSVALIQWAIENDLDDVTVTYIDTGWAGAGWLDRVAIAEEWVRRSGLAALTITPPVQFEELIRTKKGFPNQRYQWCSGILKGLPFLGWLDEADPDCRAAVFVGKRRGESKERADTPCITYSEYHGDRMLVHPLYLHTEEERDALVRRAGFELLPHRSLDCDPCVNSNRADFRRLAEEDILKAVALEQEVGKTMFRPVRHRGAKGVEQVVVWAKSKPWGRSRFDDDDEDPFGTGCGSSFGCGL